MNVSYGRYVIFVLGAGMIVLVVATILIGLLEPGPGVGLTIALCGVAGAIIAMRVVATRLTRADPDSGDPPGNQ